MAVIFALASPRGKAGVAVLRLSGPGAWAVVGRLVSRLPPAREARLRRLVWRGEVLDEALVILFPEGASFTGEESAELHLHGSPAVISAVIGALSSIDGTRIADPGEFTRRAMENGRLDLAQVEGLADLIEAETEAQRRQARRVLEGAVVALAEGWRKALIRALALVEVSIDFADEELPRDVVLGALPHLEEVRHALERERAGMAAAERLRDGFEVAIVGPPNAGKSTLLNALAGREAAITSHVAGTTRNVIELRMDLGGLPVTFLDTAGLRETDDEVERIGVARARARAEAADMRLFLLSDPEEAPAFAPRPGDIVALGKGDIQEGGGHMPLSGLTGRGVAGMLGAVEATLAGRAQGGSALGRERHRIAVDTSIAALSRAADLLRDSPETPELAAEETRRALRALDSLVGRVDVEHVLDEIFASFCLGK
ncbi:MAG: tRNA uridine-5-carboxymethylaminomethyl(34) synthesis GTPase MnmE [Rhodobacteraceae bacterium]|nr:tRNA uridine-5-carboxymethylaminomethyl(34) synthesis GTPase MnmE [Paracoccaceae bacterium]